MISKILENKKEFVLCLAVFFSVLSQTPFLRVTLNINTTLVSAPFWIISGLVAIFTIKKAYINRETKIIITLFVIFFVAIVLSEGVTGNSYILSYVTKPIYLSFFFFGIGCLFSRQISNNLIKKIAIAYIAATLILSIDIFVEYFVGVDITVVNYIFRSKNSASSILLVGIVFCLCVNFSIKKLIKIICACLIVWFTVLIILMRARAVIISMPLIPLIYLFTPGKNKIIKISIIVASLAGLVVVVSSKTLFNFLVNNILLKASNSNNVNLDINYLTSNRFYEVLYAFYIFELNPIFGNGYYYVDFFAVNSFANYGFIAGLLLIVISVSPLFVARKTILKDGNLTYTMIAVLCVFNGIFEGLAPFGPGNKFFILWLLFGLVCNRDEDVAEHYGNCLGSYETKTFVELRI